MPVSRVARAGLLVVLAATPLTAQQRPISSTDYYRLISVSDPAISPSGAAVAFTVTTVVEDQDRRHREIWLAPTDGATPPYRLTSLSTEASSPTWSPDGSLLAFSSRRDSSGVEDEDGVWFLRTGAMGGEAFRIRGVHAMPVWSKDGKWIAYLWAGEIPDSVRKNPRRGWVAPDAISRAPDPKRFDGRVITHIPYQADGRGFLRDVGSEPRQHIHVVPATGGEPRQLTDGRLPQRSIAWSPDGRYIALVQDSTDGDERRLDQHPDIYLLEVATGALRRVTTTPGYHTNPAFSPDARFIAFNCSNGRGQPGDVCVIPANGGEPQNLTLGWDLDPGAPRWSPDGSSIAFQAEVHGNVHLFRVPARGGPVTQVTQGLRQLGGFSMSADGRMMAYTSSDITHITELFVAQSNGGGEKRLTSFNDKYLTEVTTIPADTFWYESVGGLKIQAWLHQPYGYEAGKKYPLVLYIHGGPHGQYGHVYFHEFQMLAGQGYWTLFTNPRGSTGYGHDFTYATRRRWGMEDYQDLMNAVDEVIRRTAQVDTTRMAVLGGSYGGFMTNWIIGHTNRFAVAQTDRSISNWFSWYGSSEAQGLTEYEFGGFPWEQDSLYRALSPFTYVTNMKTPLLIVHSEEDYRVPITDAEQLFMALKKRGVPVEFVRYPRSSHGLSRTGPPWLLVDRLERIRTWFAHWIGTGAIPPKAAQ
ncbi:MAG: S9 family peptidase [Gemmatimonadetes bacterium]|nr:S9 family peptidase [Gemmatimonadota bacterium]